MNLNGGTFTTPVLSTHSDYSATLKGTTIGTVNFDGGTLQPTGSTSDFIVTDDPAFATMKLVVKKNATTNLGAVIDTLGYNVTITKALTHDATGPAIDGGLLVKNSAGSGGSLTLTGTLSYTGNTVIDVGTLTATAINTPSALVYVATGATLNAPSITADTLTIGGAPMASASGVLRPCPSPARCCCWRCLVWAPFWLLGGGSKVS